MQIEMNIKKNDAEIVDDAKFVKTTKSNSRPFFS